MGAKPAVKQTSVFMQFCLLLKAEILRRKPYFSVVMFVCFEKCCQISTVFNTQGDLTSSLEAKFGARSGQVHQIRGKTWEILLPQDTNVGKKS